MGARRSTPLSARERYFKRRLRRLGILLTTALVLAVAVCSSLAYPVLAPGNIAEVSLAEHVTSTPEIVKTEAVSTATEVPQASLEEQLPDLPLPTQGQIVPPSDDTHVLYYTIAGDSLPMVSKRFGVDMNEITSPESLEKKRLLNPGILLVIPNKLEETSSRQKLLPDSEVTFSPSTISFDIQGFIDAAGGYLSEYEEYLASTGWTSGADIIARVALEYSVNPRLLLAFLEYQSGWVYGFPDPENKTAMHYPMGYVIEMRKDLYLQSAWFATKIMEGYFGWREGRRLVINFQDGTELRLAPQLNAGSVGLMNAFANLYDYQDWAVELYGEENFLALFESMFDNPWIRAQEVEPLIPVDTVQPEMILPFEPNHIWAFTGGPHAAWSSADVWAAIDFAPASDKTGCYVSEKWVVASMAGRVIRSGNGVVVIDQDDDGHEQTGWTLLYLHIADEDRIPLGTWVNIGDRVGHASCLGGRSTGTHVHLARRYNGEWVPADGPLPFTLSGWETKAGTVAYKGWLVKGDQIIYANTASTYDTQLTREE